MPLKAVPALSWCSEVSLGVPLTLPFSSVAMRLGPVPAGLVHSCVGAAGRFAAVCCVKGGCSEG